MSLIHHELLVWAEDNAPRSCAVARSTQEDQTRSVGATLRAFPQKPSQAPAQREMRPRRARTHVRALHAWELGLVLADTVRTWRPARVRQSWQRHRPASIRPGVVVRVAPSWRTDSPTGPCSPTRAEVRDLTYAERASSAGGQQVHCGTRPVEIACVDCTKRMTLMPDEVFWPWIQAHHALVEAELRLTKWTLITSAPAPEDLVRNVERCRRRAQTMFRQVLPLCASGSDVSAVDPDATTKARPTPCA